MAAPRRMSVSMCVVVGFLAVCHFSVANGEGMHGEGGLVGRAGFARNGVAGQAGVAPSRKMLQLVESPAPKAPAPDWVVMASADGVPVPSLPCTYCIPVALCYDRFWCSG